MKIFLGCAEASGEVLLETLLNALLKIYPNAQYTVQASKYFAERFPQIEVLCDSKVCQMMGFIEPIRRLPQLIYQRNLIKKWVKSHQPDVFIGIDAPDFFLSLEKFAKSQGAVVLHIVSPSVWAWRASRIHTVAKSAHILLSLFEFERPLYQGTSLKTEFLGHPLVKHIGWQPKKHLKDKILLLAPGSRDQEIQHHAAAFFEIAQNMKKNKLIDRIMIAAHPSQKEHLKNILDGYSLDVSWVSLSEGAKQASFALVVSGTATLELALYRCPMVIVYHLPKWKKFLLSFLVQTKFIGLPNILSNKLVVPELIGPVNDLKQSIIEHLVALSSPQEYDRVQSALYELYHQLHQDDQRVCHHSLLVSLLSPALTKRDAELLPDPSSLQQSLGQI